MVTDDGLVKILDFGIAKLAPPGTEPTGQGATFEYATRPGQVLGTIAYSRRSRRGSRRGLLRPVRLRLHPLRDVLRPARLPEETGLQTLAAIKEREPEPLATLNRALPALRTISRTG